MQCIFMRTIQSTTQICTYEFNGENLADVSDFTHSTDQNNRVDSIGMRYGSVCVRACVRCECLQIDSYGIKYIL